MKLRKQLFSAFLSVTILPLILVSGYMILSNLILAFNLYGQNLRSSTEIQASLVEENLSRLMVRAGRFTSSRAVRTACLSGTHIAEKEWDLSNDIQNFTDETLDTVAIFALLNQNEEILYVSGSNSDIEALEELLPQIDYSTEQYISELMFSSQGDSLLIYTPVLEDNQRVGSMLTVLRTDYFLKLISGHQQMEATDALIYCRKHQTVAVSKSGISYGELKSTEFWKLSSNRALIYRVGNKRYLLYYRSLSKSPWMLVSMVPISRIFSQVWNYGLVNVIVLMGVLLIILFLSVRQSRRVVRPLEILLGAVGQFFLEGAAKFPKTGIDSKTEVGYLAEKFSNLSDEIAVTQGKLRESTYLYNALLQATYEFRIVMDLHSNTAYCTSDVISQRLNNGSEPVEKQILAFLTSGAPGQALDNRDVLEQILSVQQKESSETEVCCCMDGDREQVWYRLIAVPISEADGAVHRMVFHFEDITLKKLEEIRLIQSAQRDPLCGLLNKTAFPLHCQQSSDGKTDAIFFIDLDHFKRINDTLGHAVGDEILVEAAQKIQEQFRDSDTVGRFGGDEFVVFAPNMTEALTHQKGSLLVKELFFEREGPQGNMLQVTASVGICIMTSRMTLEQAIRLADQAMYHAKGSGKSQYHLRKEIV